MTGTPASTPIWATTTSTGTFSVTEVQAITLDAGATFNGDNQMQMFAEPLTVSCSVASGKMGTPYSSSVGVAGGIAPYTFVVTSGSLPSGLSMDISSGLITGTPQAAGTFSYTVQITDSQGYVAISTCPLTIALGGGTGQGGLSLTCPGSSATSGMTYSSSFVASGGVSPYMFSISSGSLPSGLTLNASTGAVTGKPTGSGTVSFTGKVVDSTAGTALSTTSTCSIAFASAVKAGDTATIGFWHNKNGQALILALNGGSTSKTLATWLATSFPHLYGVYSTHNLTGKTNTDVAALFMSFFNAGGQKTSAQVMAVALASYVTSSSLAGTTAVKYGFNSSSAGTGAAGWNVGTNGTAIGLTNNQSYPVLQILQQADQAAGSGTFNDNAFNTICNGINTTGDIV